MKAAYQHSHARPAFAIPARTVVVFSGLVAIALGLLHLVDEVQRGETRATLIWVAVLLAGVWLLSLFLIWRGNRVALLVAGTIAFAEFATQGLNHFVSGGSIDLGALARTRGLPAAIALLFLGPSCLIMCVAAMDCAANPRGRATGWRGLIALGLSAAGGTLVLLHAADDLHRSGFGSLSAEDGAFVAMVIATVWVLGGLSTAGHLRRGTFFVIAATLFVLIPFYNLHLASGGVSLGKIASESGMAWALVAAATAVCAGLALAFSLLVLGLQLSVRRRPQGKAPAPALKKA